MLKLVVLSLMIVAASAGYLGYPSSLAYSSSVYASHAPVIAHAAPIVHAPLAIAHAPVATSYSNSYRTVHKPVLAAYSAPIVAHAPLSYGLGYGYSSYLHRK